jgi:hypothetical protein
MVVVLTLTPLWVVLWRRVQAGRWIELPASARNAAWTPPPAMVSAEDIRPETHDTLSPGARAAWRVIGAVSVVAILIALVLRSSSNPYGGLSISRDAAEQAARAELARRGVTLPAKWRVMGVPDDGSGGPQQYVYESAGEARWRELLGVYLPKPRWRVRAATFEGDVADRAEEWRIFVDSAGVVRNVQHVIPEARAGASLDEAAARSRALAAVQERFGLAPAQLKEISAKPAKQKARMDWTFTFADTTVAPIAAGEARLDATLAGDEVASVTRYVFVPEAWARQQRAVSTRNLVIQIATSVVFGGLLLGAAIAGMMAWSRGHYAPKLFLLAAAMALAASVANLANGWPTLVAALPTTAPLQLQLLGVIAVAAIGLTLLAAMIGLAIGAMPVRLAGLPRVDNRDALPLGLAIGVFAAALGAAAAAIRTPGWARYAAVDSLGSFLPILDVALDPIASLMTGMAVVLTAAIGIDRMTASWTRRRALAMLMVGAIGFLAGGIPAGSHAAAWALAGAIMAAGFAVVYATLLRFDPTLVPIALGAMAVIRAVGLAAQRPFPGAIPGVMLAVAIVSALSWWWFRLLRRVV